MNHQIHPCLPETVKAPFDMTRKLALSILPLLLVVGIVQADTLATLRAYVPLISSSDVPSRYKPQMEVQAFCLKATRPGAEQERKEVAEALSRLVLDDTLPHPARIWFIRQLQYVGAAEAVPALNRLLQGKNEDIKENARRALEKNPSRLASKALFEALKRGGYPRWKIGLINSLGERRDTASVGLIAKGLSDPALAPVACMALAKIADPVATEILMAAFEHRVEGSGDAMIILGDQLLDAGQPGASARVFQQVVTSRAPSTLRAASLVGLAVANPGSGNQLAEVYLRTPNSHLLSAAVTAIRLADPQNATLKLANLLPQLPSRAQRLILPALDARAEPQVLALTRSEDAAVRLLAIQTLGRIGSEASVKRLLALATSGSSEEGSAAVDSLKTLKDAKVNNLLLASAINDDPPVQATALEALAARGDDSVINGLAQLAAEGNQPAADTLRNVLARSKNKSAAASALVALLEKADQKGAVAILSALPAAGGTDALKAVVTRTQSPDEAVKDAAIRALANWNEFAATTPLLKIASNENLKLVYNVLSIQAIARLSQSAREADAQVRAEAAIAAMKAARRDQDKLAALSALASTPSPVAVETVMAHLSDEQFKAEAALVAISLAEAIAPQDREAARQLAEAAKAAGLNKEAMKRADQILR